MHLADSLVALELDAVRAATTDRRPRLGRRVSRPGAGGRAARSRGQAVESQRRKCEFLERACARARIANARVGVHARRGVERGPGGHDRRGRAGAGARSRSCSSTRRRCCAGGRLVDWRGRRGAEEEAASERGRGAARACGGRRYARCVRSPARASATCTCTRRSATRPTASRGAPGSRASGRSASLRVPQDAAAARYGGHASLTVIGASLPAWARFTRSPTRRAAWARRRPRSTWRRASPRPATRRCSSTSTRRRTRPSGWASPRAQAPGLYEVLAGDADGQRRAHRHAGRRPASCSRPARAWRGRTSSCRGSRASSSACASASRRCGIASSTSCSTARRRWAR